MNENNQKESALETLRHKYVYAWRIYRTYVDKTIIYPKERWVFTLLMIFLYAYRLYITQGYFVITYLLGLYLLDLFLGFISPQDEAEDGDFDVEEDQSILPSRDTDEYKPFRRKVKEFDLWLSFTKVLLICILLTFIQKLDIPIFWPLLLFYFIMITFLTIKNRIMHMIKHKYIPLDLGKKIYNGKK